MATQAQRNEIVSIAEYLIGQASTIHYPNPDVRPGGLMSTRTIPSLEALKQMFGTGRAVTMDCSEAVTFVFRLAGLEDPNGLNYNGEGFTGTLLSHLPHYTDINRAHPGAIVIFGTGTGDHACIVLEHDISNPFLFSHGSEIGPLKIQLEDEKRAHEGQPITLLDISKL
jgi:hypothetical protein